METSQISGSNWCGIQSFGQWFTYNNKRLYVSTKEQDSFYSLYIPTSRDIKSGFTKGNKYMKTELSCFIA